MAEDMDEIKRLPAEDNEWFPLLSQNSSIWNAYMHSVAEDEASSIFLQGIPELTQHEKRELHRSIRASSPNWDPPSGEFINLHQLIWNKHLNILKKTLPTHTHFDLSKFNGLLIYKCKFAFASFSSCTFTKAINIKNCAFYEGASFARSFFKGMCEFKACTFKDTLSLNHSTFEAGVVFSDCIFEGSLDGTNITCNGKITFENCIFRGDLILDGSRINSSIRLFNCTFNSPPSLVGANIIGDVDINMDSIIFLPARQADISRWIKLKYEMNRLHRHREEADFFTKELECRALDRSAQEKALINLYKVFSDYGRGILMPFGWLIGLVVFSTILYKFNFFYEKSGWMESIYLGIKGSIPLLPYDRHLGLNSTEFNAGFGTFKTMALMLTRAVHMTVAGILLFLIGLGIRNRLRIK